MRRGIENFMHSPPGHVLLIAINDYGNSLFSKLCDSRLSTRPSTLFFKLAHLAARSNAIESGCRSNFKVEVL